MYLYINTYTYIHVYIYIYILKRTLFLVQTGLGVGARFEACSAGDWPLPVGLAGRTVAQACGRNEKGAIVYINNNRNIGIYICLYIYIYIYMYIYIYIYMYVSG